MPRKKKAAPRRSKAMPRMSEAEHKKMMGKKKMRRPY